MVDSKYSDRSFFGKEIYVYQSDLVAYDETKESLKPFKSFKNLVKSGINQETYENKVAGVPFIDESLGMLCVKVLTEYEKAVDLVFFENLVKQVAKEGTRILLDSRGLISDDITIDNLLTNYYTFTYVLNADNLANFRPCSNIDFIVGIPLRFLNNIEVNTTVDNFDESQAIFKLNLNSIRLLSNTEKILQALSSRATEYYNFLYPDKFTPGFVLNYDLLAVREYVSSLTELMDYFQKPLRNDNPFDFELGYDKNLKLVYVKVIDGNEEYIPKSMLNTFTFRPSFTSQRVINYFINADRMLLDSRTLSLLDFLKKYVKYPDIEFKNVEFKLGNGEVLPKDITDTFVSSRAKNSELCVSATSAINDIAFSNPAYHFFWNEFGKKEEKPPVTENEKIRLLQEKAESDKRKAEYDAARKGGLFSAFGGVTFKGTWDNTLAGASTGVTEGLRGQVQSFTGGPVGGTGNVPTTLNILFNVNKRLNLYDYIIKKLICYAKQSNSQSSAELAAILEKIGPDLWNYIIYVSQIQADPSSKSFYQQAIRGLGRLMI